MTRAVLFAAVAFLALAGIAAQLVAVRRGYSGLVHAIAWRRWLRRSRRSEGCVRCGGDLTRYVWVDLKTGDRETHCAACHVTGQRYPGAVCIDLRHNVDWTISEVECRVGSYVDAVHRIDARRTRRASSVPVGPVAELGGAR